MDGVALAHGGCPQDEGKNRFDTRESDGSYYAIRSQIEVVRSTGDGFLIYRKPKPVSSPNEVIIAIMSAEKTEPLSPRAAATREKLLLAGAQLLAEVGIERISTNQVAAHAGVTPPVFYRHFKDKYELLAALGEALMERQNAILYDWLERAALGGFNEMVANHHTFLLTTIKATVAIPGAIWIMRAMRAVPSLAAIRLTSIDAVTDRVMRVIAPLIPEGDPAELRLRTRIALEAIYAVVDRVAEDPNLSPEQVCRTLTEIWIGGFRHGIGRS